jgi:hypothetical protein
MKLFDIARAAMRDLQNRTSKALVKPARNVTFAWPLEDASLMLAFAQHYNKSASSIGAETFAPMMTELFRLLPESDRKEIAVEADRMIVKFIELNHCRESVNLTNWQDFNARDQIK